MQLHEVTISFSRFFEDYKHDIENLRDQII